MFNKFADNPILMLILLFIFAGNNDFDTTQLLLVLALFSTLNGLDLDGCCRRPRCPNPDDDLAA